MCGKMERPCAVGGLWYEFGALYRINKNCGHKPGQDEGKSAADKTRAFRLRCATADGRAARIRGKMAAVSWGLDTQGGARRQSRFPSARLPWATICHPYGVLI